MRSGVNFLEEGFTPLSFFYIYYLEWKGKT